MTDKLPPNLLALFAPRPALRYLPPSDHAPESRKTHAISGVASFLDSFEEYKQEPYESKDTWFEKKERAKVERREKLHKVMVEDFANCRYCGSDAHLPQMFITDLFLFLDKPADDPQVRGDPYRTLFIARLSYETKEIDLEKEFGRYGPIERVRLTS